MYKYILEQAGNINWMALFALLTFCFVFGTSLWLVFRRDKNYINHMASLPLDEDSLSTQNQ